VGVYILSVLSIAPTTSANTQARLARHAKLKLHQPEAPRAGNFVSRGILNVKHSLCLDGSAGVLSQIGIKVVTLTAAFLLITPFLPFYQNTEGSAVGGLEELNVTEQDPNSALATVMTEDGFLLKPSLETAESDRTSFNEVFAYSVEPGDTLSSIAERFGLKKETVMWENDLWNPNQVKTGITLKILPVDGVSHLVKKGETVASIAKKYKIDSKIIVKQNQLEDQSLVADTLLIIPGATRALPIPSFKGGGNAPALPPGSAFVAGGKMLWPTLTAARITQKFHRGHYAVDIANRARGPIYAAASGKVVLAKYGWDGGYGNYIILDHGNGMQTLYGHAEKLYVSEGQYVEKGQTIAWMGSTGHSSGPHVHFEVRINGVKYNPLNFLSQP